MLRVQDFNYFKFKRIGDWKNWKHFQGLSRKFELVVTVVTCCSVVHCAVWYNLFVFFCCLQLLGTPSWCSTSWVWRSWSPVPCGVKDSAWFRNAWDETTSWANQKRWWRSCTRRPNWPLFCKYRQHLPWSKCARVGVPEQPLFRQHFPFHCIYFEVS